MEYMTIIFRALFSAITLFLITKLIGCRQVSTMSIFDYITSITIGSIAAEIAINPEVEFTTPLLAMLVYGLLSIALSKITQISISARRILNGTATILYLHGTFYYKHLKRARMEINELLMECRVNGFFDLSQVEAIILEPNGKISILPVTKHQPVTSAQLNLAPEQEAIFMQVISEGVILEKNLKAIGKDNAWLHNQLAFHNVKNCQQVFLALCNRNGDFRLYKKQS